MRKRIFETKKDKVDFSKAEIITSGEYKGYYLCKECGYPTNRVDSVRFGSYMFCQDCVAALGIGPVADEYEDKFKFSCYDGEVFEKEFSKYIQGQNRLYKKLSIKCSSK